MSTLSTRLIPLWGLRQQGLPDEDRRPFGHRPPCSFPRVDSPAVVGWIREKRRATAVTYYQARFPLVARGREGGGVVGRHACPISPHAGTLGPGA